MPQYKRRGVSPTNPDIIYLESEDGREVPVTRSLADMLVPGEMPPPPMGGYGASEPIAQPQRGMGGRIRPRYVQGPQDVVIEGQPDPTAVVPSTPGAVPNATQGLAEARQRQEDEAARPFLRPTERDLQLDAQNEASAAPATPEAVPPAIPGQLPPGSTGATGIAPVQGQQAPGGMGGIPLPAEVANADLNANGIPDLFEQAQGGGSGISQQATTTTTQHAPIDPGTLDELGYRSNVEREANEALADTVSEGIAEIADIEGQTREQLAAHDRESNRMRDEATIKVTSMAQARQEAAQRLLTGRIDPDRYLGSRGSMGRVGAAIAMTMRDIAGIYAGRDLGPSLIMREIDRDIAAQEANLDQAAREFEAGGQMLQEMRQVYGDEADARAAVRATLIENAIRQVRVASLQNANAEVRQRGMVVEAELQRIYQQTLAGLQQNAWTRTLTETVRARPGSGGGSQAPRVTPQNLNAYSGAYSASQPRRGAQGEGPPPPVPVAGLRFGTPDGQAVWDAASNAERADFRRNEARFRRVSRNMAQLRDLVGHASSISPADRAQAETLVAGILPQLNQYASGTANALQGAEIDLLAQIARNPTALWSQTDSTRRALDQAIDMVSGWAEADRSLYDFQADTTALDAARARAGN